MCQASIEHLRQHRDIQDDPDNSQHQQNAKYALWALSNIAAGPPYMLDALLKDRTLEEVSKIAEEAGWQDVRAEALFTVTNMVTNATES